MPDWGAERVWKSSDLDSHHGGIVLLDGYLYGSRRTPQWVCLEWKTGKTMYEERSVGNGSPSLQSRSISSNRSLARWSSPSMLIGT